MRQHLPDGCFDVGIAGGHAVTVSAGAAAAGLTPICNIYSSFMQRAYDNVIHDVAIQNLHVILCLDRGGLVGEDGATHHGAYDLAYFSSIPNLTICAPMDELELRNMLYTATMINSPFVIRYPRGNGVGTEWQGKEFSQMNIGKGRKLKDGEQIAILSIGTVGNTVTKAIDNIGDRISIAHYDMRYAKPLDEQILHEVGSKFKCVITIEDGSIRGGVGEAITALFNRNNYAPKVENLGIPDRFIEHGTPDDLHSECGYDQLSIEAAIERLVK